MTFANSKENKTNRKRTWMQWLPVIVLMAIAAVIRLKVTSPSDYYLLEGDGPYYPLQVRGLLQDLRLPLPDVPLTFIIEAFMVKILQVFNVASLNDNVLLAIRITDAILPPLAAIPIFLIYRELSEGSKLKFTGYLVLAFALLNFSPVFIFFPGPSQKRTGSCLGVQLFVLRISVY